MIDGRAPKQPSTMVPTSLQATRSLIDNLKDQYYAARLLPALDEITVLSKIRILEDLRSEVDSRTSRLCRLYSEMGLKEELKRPRSRL